MGGRYKHSVWMMSKSDVTEGFQGNSDDTINRRFVTIVNKSLSNSGVKSAETNVASCGVLCRL